MLLNAVLQCVTVSAYASRLAGARSGRVATAISLFNLFVTIGRFASMIYTPILGSLADKAGFYASRVGVQDLAGALPVFQWQLRAIVLAGAAGVGLGAILMPTFVMIYVRGISAFERTGSLPKAVFRLLMPRTALGVMREVRFASMRSLLGLSWRRVPKDVMILNTFVTSIYGIGVVSAALASVLDPHVARTALLSSGLINGVATIAYNFVVDPTSAYMTDQTVKGERPIEDVRSLVGFLALTAMLGFMISQILLVPAALIIGEAARFVTPTAH